MNAIDIPSDAEWSLVSEDAQRAAAEYAGRPADREAVIFRAVYTMNDMRYTCFFEPQEILHILNRKPTPKPL